MRYREARLVAKYVFKSEVQNVGMTSYSADSERLAILPCPIPELSGVA